jgi:DNA-binding CsgD family transcriptional regulator
MKTKTATIHIDDPGVLGAITDLETMGIWECLRRCRRPMPAEELATLVERPVGRVQRCLDLLERAGLLRKSPVRGSRRFVAYAVSSRSISIEFDRSDPVQRRAVERVIRYVEQEVPKELFRSPIPLESLSALDWHFHHCSPLVLDPDDLVELKRRIARVEEFIDLLRDKVVESEPTKAPRCNHAISIRIEPLAEHVLPQPAIELISKSVVRERQRTPGLVTKRLSDREREVAQALRQGASRAAVAARLGLSILTVGTLCKRLYRKLGIRRAGELHQFDLG